MGDEARYRAAEARLWATTGATPEDRRVHLRHLDVTVRLQRVGDGPAVLFVHGANTSGISWATLAARLTGFSCLLLDRPGTGLSERLPRSLDDAALADFGEALIADVLDGLDLPTAHVVATSFGGYAALRGAAAHPDRIDRMVLYSWPFGAPAAHVPGSMRLLTMPVIGGLLASIPPSERSVRMSFRQIGHGPSLEDHRITQADLDTYLALLRETDTLRNELTMGRAFMSPRRGVDRHVLPDDVLSAIRAPTHLIWGARDPFGGPAVAEALVTRIPGATLEVLPDAAHAPWLDDLDRCASSTDAFLRGDATPASSATRRG